MILDMLSCVYTRIPRLFDYIVEFFPLRIAEKPAKFSRTPTFDPLILIGDRFELLEQLLYLFCFHISDLYLLFFSIIPMSRSICSSFFSSKAMNFSDSALI